MIMASDSTAVIFYRGNLFFISSLVSIDKRLAMRSQPNLASRSEVVSIYKCPQTFGPFSSFGETGSQIWGAKTSNFDHYPHSTVDTAYLRNETSHR